MKVVINPKYSHLSDIINELPTRKFTGNSIIREKRNSIYQIEVDGQVFVIKKYKRPTRVNQVIYSYFRLTKARRAYEFAFRLESLGIDTPEPVAYIELKKGGVFHTGYFVSTFMGHPSVEDAVYEEREGYKEILDAFVDFTVQIHEKGVLHYDYNLSNALYYQTEQGYQFALIDINQMKFGKLSLGECLKSVNSLGLSLPQLVWFVEQYALRRGKNPLNCCTSILLRQRARLIRRGTKKKLQNMFVYPVRDFFKKSKSVSK
ncbi:lipopolysaccharide kinase InaA family protein [Bacteroides sp. 214]|uniref:lipopolysaccharide kinase InaA family protein n=1 Tax=Bacteroides sp. 214 TaxID=2302935 RepID=UPI0013D740D4|nr:lipopolysaccharide kinase InaA family protein [Bacteroides sp. 214]